MTRCYLLAERSLRANVSLAGSLWVAQPPAPGRGRVGGQRELGPLRGCRPPSPKGHIKISVLPYRNILCLRADLLPGCQGRAAFAPFHYREGGYSVRFLSARGGGGGDGITWCSKGFNAWPKMYLALKDVQVPKNAEKHMGPDPRERRLFLGRD